LSKKYDLTEGGIVNKLFLVALPLIGTSVIQMTYNLTDMLWLGRLSSYAVAASGIVGLFLWLSMAFMLIGRMGAEIGVSQNLGKGDKEKAKIFAQNSIFISFIVGVVLAFIYIFGRELLISFFGIQEQHVVHDAQDYLAIVSMALPMFFVTAAVSGIFNGAGNSRMSLKINGVGLALNITLSPILIFPAGLGIRGAAIATVIAQGTAAIIAVIAITKNKNRPFNKIKLISIPEAKIVKQIFKWVTPISIESFLFTFMTMITTAFIAYYGAGSVAASRISTQIESLTWLIAGGFASALTAFVGQNYGAKKWDRINRSFKVATAMMVGWGVIVSAILYLGSNVLIAIFAPGDLAVIQIGAEFMRILAIIQVPGCLEGVASGSFRGRGKTIPPSVVSITCNSLRVVLAYVLSQHTALGLTGIWIAISAGAGARGLWMYIWYYVDSRKLLKAGALEALDPS
jgi:putative MATE family efflux protein